MRWIVGHHRGTASELHALDMVDDGCRRIWVLEPTGPSVVLGSTQSAGSVDADRAGTEGIEVVRRRSGGGAVWVAPDDPVWIDVLVPRGDRLWDDDVGRSFLPIGRAWVAALESQGLEGLSVHDGALVSTDWSSLVCFAGIGPGEVMVGEGKVVGISQRRTRAGARFQCALPRTWDPGPLQRLLRPTPPAGVLDRCGAGIGPVSATALIAALATALGGGTDSLP